MRLARDLDAVIVVEKNFGGQFLVGLLEQAMSELGVRAPVRVIDAHHGKRVRAEPVALLFETGRAHMVAPTRSSRNSSCSSLARAAKA